MVQKYLASGNRELFTNLIDIFHRSTLLHRMPAKVVLGFRSSKSPQKWRGRAEVPQLCDGSDNVLPLWDFNLFNMIFRQEARFMLNAHSRNEITVYLKHTQYFFRICFSSLTVVSTRSRHQGGSTGGKEGSETSIFSIPATPAASAYQHEGRTVGL